MRFVMWAGLLIAIATPSLAQQPSPDATAAPVVPAAAPAKPKKVCRTFQVTGRRISSTECYTAAQWADYDRTQNEAASKMINDVSSAGAKSNFHSGSLNTLPMFGIGPQ